MNPIWRTTVCIVCVLGIIRFSDAAHYQVKFPLNGRNAYRAATGQVTFSETVGSTTRDDGTTLVIEVSNVPLPPKTELLVFVHEELVGRLKLTKDRSGRLVLESTKKQTTPRIKAGSFVTMQLEDGTQVIW